MITIVDYGLGNLGSIANMLKKVGAEAEITGDLEKIYKAKKIILPGVGAFDKAMEKLTETELRKVLDDKAQKEKIPFLGICLGMQLLGGGSEEGKLPGLNWISAYTYKFSFADNKLKVPHMSWNDVHVLKQNELLQISDDTPSFYFSHSYFVLAENADNIIATTNYGVMFHSVIQKDNIYGAQFHAEKSHKYGMKFFENFANL